MNSPFLTQKRPYFSYDQIEVICAQALAGVGLLPPNPEPIRIDRFLEKRFHISPEYEDLPPGVLGFTLFAPEGPQSVVINRQLDEDTNSHSQKRVRSTLAHEAGHILLHSDLFGVSSVIQLNLLSPMIDRPKVLCRDDSELSTNNHTSYKGKWWEYQANMVIGAILLPKQLLAIAIEPFLEPAGSLRINRLNENVRDYAAQKAAQVFDVNPVVARIRLDQLYPSSVNDQLSI